MNDQTRVQEAQKELAELCQKYNVRVEPRITIVANQINSDLLVVANPNIVPDPNADTILVPSKTGTNQESINIPVETSEVETDTQT